MFSPMIDAVRPTRKSNAIGAIRDTGNPHSSVSMGVVQNPANRTRTTIREMTENRKNHMFVGNQTEPGHQVNKHSPIPQQRDTTNIHYIGTMGNTSTTSNTTSYASAYNANLIDKTELLEGRDPNGNMGLFSGPSNINLSISKKEHTHNNYNHIPNMKGSVPSVQFKGIQQYKNKTSNMEDNARLDSNLLKTVSK